MDPSSEQRSQHDTGFELVVSDEEREQLVELLLRLGAGRPHHAVASFSEDNKLIYTPVDSPLTPELVRKHLSGEITLGIYQIDPTDNNVSWLCWDIDTPDMATGRRIAQEIQRVLEPLPTLMEYSGRKGYHVWLLLQEEIPAKEAKVFAATVRDHLGFAKTGETHVECFPKQERIRKQETSERRSLGNLVKLPLGIHPVTKNRSGFVELSDSGHRFLPPAPELRKRVSWEQVKLVVSKLSEHSYRLLEQIIVENWRSGKRHELSLALAGFLAKSAWDKARIENLIKVVCEQTEDSELFNRLQSIEDTFAKLDRGEEVAGLSALKTLLGEETAQRLAKLVAQIEFSVERLNGNVATYLRSIRLKRMQNWLKEVVIMEQIWRYMLEHGRLLRTETVTGAGELIWRIYWYNEERHHVIPVHQGNQMFVSEFFSRFGINPLDAFGTHILQMLVLKAAQQAETVEVYNKSVLRDGKLYLYWGGDDVWILDGEKIERQDNGAGDIFFVTSHVKPVTPDFDNPLDIWSFLFGAVNFQRTGDAPIPAAEQLELLKAWYLAFFLRSLLPTRPILALLGPPGSGKTTIARQMLRLATHPDDDVLDLQEDKPDSIRVSMEFRPMIILDNLEKFGGSWLVKRLNQAATSSHIEIRELYHTNAPYLIRSDAFFVLTAVNMPFSEETLFERMIVLTLEKLERFKPTYLFERELKVLRPRLLADLMQKLNRVVKHLATEPMPASVGEVRMADFAALCHRLATCPEIGLEGRTLLSGLSILRRGQAQALSHSEHSVLPVIEQWIRSEPEEAAKRHTAAELQETLSNLAKKMGRTKWRFTTPQALSTHLAAQRTVLEREFNAQFEEVFDSNKGRKITYYAFPGWSATPPTEPGQISAGKETGNVETHHSHTG